MKKIQLIILVIIQIIILLAIAKNVLTIILVPYAKMNIHLLMGINQFVLQRVKLKENIYQILMILQII